jgi:hypothetical protein
MRKYFCVVIWCNTLFNKGFVTEMVEMIVYFMLTAWIKKLFYFHLWSDVHIYILVRIYFALGRVGVFCLLRSAV